MPNFGTLVLGPLDIRRFSAEYRFAEYRRSRITLLRLGVPSLDPLGVFAWPTDAWDSCAINLLNNCYRTN